MRKLLPITLIILITSCQKLFDTGIDYIHKEIKPSEINEKIPAYKLHEDIDEFIRILEEVHVNPYMRIPKEEFYNAVDNLKKSIKDSLTRQQFYQVFTPLVDTLNDSHTGVRFPSGIWKYYQYEADGLFLPVDVTTTFDKRIFVKHDYSKNNLPPDTEILTINSIKSEDIINTFLKYEHSPIQNSSIKRLERKFIDYLWWILDFKGPYTVETGIGTYEFEGQTWPQYVENRNKIMQNNQTSLEEISLNEINKEICMLKITSFSISPSEFKTQIEEQFKLIQQKGYENLIIDVRDNGGGNDENGRSVIDLITDKPTYSDALAASIFMMKRSKRYDDYHRLRYPGIIRWMVNLRTSSWFNKEFRKLFTQLRKVHYGENLEVHLPLREAIENPYRFQGNVYALSNHNSYSATTAFLGAIKDYKIGTIIGTETGDNPTGFGNNLYFELKNTRLLCHSSTTFQIRPYGDTDMTHGVIPDFYVEQTTEDTEKNLDTVLEYTLDLIDKTNHNNVY